MILLNEIALSFFNQLTNLQIPQLGNLQLQKAARREFGQWVWNTVCPRIINKQVASPLTFVCCLESEGFILIRVHANSQCQFSEPFFTNLPRTFSYAGQSNSKGYKGHKQIRANRIHGLDPFRKQTRKWGLTVPEILRHSVNEKSGRIEPFLTFTQR